LDILDEIETTIKSLYDKKHKDNKYDDDFFSLYPLSDMATNIELRNVIKDVLIGIDNKLNDFNDADDGHFFYQIICSIYMASGTPICDELLKLGIKAGNDDEWASRDEDRASYMSSYIDALKSYNPENPIYEQTEGLFSLFGTTQEERDSMKPKWISIKEFNVIH
jgi:hypothetical protein